MINRADAGGTVQRSWGSAVVSSKSEVPPFGEQLPYDIVRELDPELSEADCGMVRHTLPIPLPCNNYPMVFAPEQHPRANEIVRPSYPLHQAPIPDLRTDDGPKVTAPITLGQWVRAGGVLEVRLDANRAHRRVPAGALGRSRQSLHGDVVARA